MPVQTHVVRMVFLVLCLSMLTLQNGCSNSGSGQADAPASNANAVSLALSTTSGSTAVVADGHSTIPVRIQVTNGTGTGMAGVPVAFATTAGQLSESPVVRSTSRALSGGNSTTATRADSSGSMTVTTDTNGVGQVLLTASTTAGTASVTADAMGFRTHIDIFFVPGPAARVQLNTSPNTVNAGGTATLTATVTDANSNLVPGETVTFTLSTNTSGASLSPTSGSTDINGQVTVKYTAGTTAGVDTVRALAASTSVAGSTSITVTAPPPPPGTGTPVPGRIDLLVSSPQLDSNGSKTVTLTAVVRNATNNFLSGVAVNFAASSGGIEVTSDTTGATGTATALLRTGGDPTNRTIVVTATTGTGTLSSTNTVQVTGTTLTVSGASSLVLGGKTQLSIVLRDSGGTGIANQLITVTSENSNPISAKTTPPFTTDFTGQTTVEVTALFSGSDMITFSTSVLGATPPPKAPLSISADNFVLTACPPPPSPAPPCPPPPPPSPSALLQVQLNTPQTLTVHWDQAGVPQVGQKINFFATRGDFAVTATCPSPGTMPTITPPPTTDAAGNATVYICADNAGPAVISANVTGGPSNQVSIEFFATIPNSLVLQAFPTTLGVNASGSTTQQSAITAIVQDVNGNLVKNQTVSFTLTDVTGGSIFPASGVTDSFGRASTVYTSGTVPSAQTGVIITATVGTVPPVQVKLTVAQQALFVTLGTGNVILTPSNIQFALPYSVLVTDANGNAVTNATVELTALPTRYRKGIYVQNGPPCTGWVQMVSNTCDNEDMNHNGVLDMLPFNEDTNNNNELDPENPISVPGRIITDATGFAFFNIVYAREFASWIEVDLRARATVTGSEGLSHTVFFLPGLASDYTNCTVPPPGVVSPYGTALACTDPN